MTINRRYRRDFRENLSFYICTVFLTMAVVMLYVMMAGAANGEDAYVKQFVEDNYQEDAQFTTYLPMSDKNMEDMEKKYDLVLETQEYVDCDLPSDKTVRVFRPTEKINVYTVTEGEDISEKGEILLSAAFAQTNGYQIGDTIRLEDKEFTITGYLVRPDYIYSVKNQTDSDVDMENFGFAALTREAFDAMEQSEVSSYVSVIYNKDNETEFRQDLYDTYMTSGYLSKSANLRISFVQDTTYMFRITNNTVVPVMLAAIILIIAVVLSMKIRRERKLIGILYANGYSRARLAFHYSLSGVIAGLTGSVLGILAGLAAVKPVSSMFFMKLEPLPANYSVGVSELLFLLVTPALAFFVGAFLISFRILRGEAIDMLSNRQDDKEGRLLRLDRFNWSFRTKFRVRSILGNPMRMVVLLLGFCAAGLFVVFSLSFMDSIDAFADNSVDEIGDFQYEYYLNSIETGTPKGGVPVIVTSAEDTKNGSGVTIMGMEDNKYINTTLLSGESADLKNNKYYISRMGAKIYGVEKGDSLEIMNPVTMEEDKIRISGIISNDVQNVIYTSRENVAEMIGISEDSYNMVASGEKLGYRGSELLQTVTRQSFKDQTKKANEDMKSMLYMLVAFGVIFCILIVYLIVNMFVSENKSTISMFQVLGYQNRAVNRIVTSIYHMFLPVGILLGLAVGMLFSRALSESLVDLYNAYIEIVISAKSAVLYVALVAAAYFISLILLRRKARKIDMIESLKDNRE